MLTLEAEQQGRVHQRRAYGLPRRGVPPPQDPHLHAAGELTVSSYSQVLEITTRLHEEPEKKVITMKKLRNLMAMGPHWFSGRIPKLLLLVVLIIMAVPHFASSATFTVNSTTDANAVSPGNCARRIGVCTLRAAIQESNALRGFPPTEIILPPGTYALTGGNLEIRSSLFLIGADQKMTFIDGARNGRGVLDVFGDDGPIVNISDITIQNGLIEFRGGGLLVRSGAFVNLVRSTVQNNESFIGSGGGIDNTGFIQLVETTVGPNNRAPTGGAGGQENSGGGISNHEGATLIIVKSAIVGNLATRGGGIRNSGHMEISNSTISGNSAETRGGGIINEGTAFIAFSTITKNQTMGFFENANDPSSSGGGGIYNGPIAAAGLVSRVEIGNSILAGNTAPRSASPDCFSVSPSTFPSFRGNLVGILDDNCNLRDTIFGEDVSFDMVGTKENPLDPRLGPLDINNGGPTQTHAFLRGPAIDQGTGVTSARFFDCPETDQRGLTRPVDGDGDGKADCDVGAFEFGAIPPSIVTKLLSLASNPVTSFSAIPTPDGPAGTFFITATFTNTSTFPIRKAFFQVIELSGGNVLINSDDGPAGVGATLTPDVGPDRILTSGESVTAEFRIGLQTLNRFTFLVNVMGETVR